MAGRSSDTWTERGQLRWGRQSERRDAHCAEIVLTYSFFFKDRCALPDQNPGKFWDNTSSFPVVGGAGKACCVALTCCCVRLGALKPDLQRVIVRCTASTTRDLGALCRLAETILLTPQASPGGFRHRISARRSDRPDWRCGYMRSGTGAPIGT